MDGVGFRGDVVDRGLRRRLGRVELDDGVDVDVDHVQQDFDQHDEQREHDAQRRAECAARGDGAALLHRR
jgi:hypothetical protein